MCIELLPKSFAKVTTSLRILSRSFPKSHVFAGKKDARFNVIPRQMLSARSRELHMPSSVAISDDQLKERIHSSCQILQIVPYRSLEPVRNSAVFAFRASDFGRFCVSCVRFRPFLRFVRRASVTFSFRATSSAVFAFRVSIRYAPSAKTPDASAPSAKTPDASAPSAKTPEGLRTKRKSTRRIPHQAQRRPEDSAPSANPPEGSRTKRKDARRSRTKRESTRRPLVSILLRANMCYTLAPMAMTERFVRRVPEHERGCPSAGRHLRRLTHGVHSRAAT